MRKKLYILIIIVAVVLAAAIFGYCKWVSPTKIAFVNYQAAALGKYHKLNNNSWIKIKEVSVEDLSKLSGYDMVFVNGMGLRIVEEQRAQLRKIAEKGIPIYTSMATNPDNDICNLDTATVSVIKKYIGGGSKKNYRSLLNYVRKYIDGKKVSVYDPEPPVEQTFNADDGILESDHDHITGRIRAMTAARPQKNPLTTYTSIFQLAVLMPESSTASSLLPMA